MVEALRDVARHLEVLLLVLADGHEIGVVEQDVGRHQHRIGEQPVIGRDALRDLVLVGVARARAGPSASRVESSQASSLTSGTSDWRNRIARAGIEAAGQVVERHAARERAPLAGVCAREVIEW